MIELKIGNEEPRNLEDVNEGWINQRINRRRAEGVPVCVRVHVHTDYVRIRLSTPSCANGGGGGRPPNEKEKRVFELWERLGLTRVDFTGGNLIAFLKQVEGLCN